MELEFALEGLETDEAYEMDVEANTGSGAAQLDWRRLVEVAVADLRAKEPVSVVAARFHNGLVEAMVAVAKKEGMERVALSGGCFQNRYLLERSVLRLRAEGFQPYWHQRIPTNDGGIALGQVAAAFSGAG
jgi:hydrogenase maturation protein HypF